MAPPSYLQMSQGPSEDFDLSSEISEVTADESESDSDYEDEPEQWQTRCEVEGVIAEAPLFSPTFCGVEILEEAVRELANKEKKSVPMSQCVGPTLRTQVFECILQLVVKVLLLLLGMWRTSLDADDVRKSWIFGVMICLLVLLILEHYRAEYFCFKHTTIPYAQAKGRFQIMGIELGFTIFAAWGLLFSFLQLLGLWTTTIFTANNLFQPFTSRKDISLGSNSIVFSQADAWCATLNQSMVPVAARAEWKDIVVGIAWLLTALPEIYSVLRYLPRPGQDRILSKVQAKPFTDGQITSYTLLNGETTSVGSAAYDLAEGAGMGTIRLQTPSFPESKANAVFREIENNITEKCPAKNVLRGLQHITGVLPRAIRRILLEALAKNVGQANVQVTLFAMSRLHNNGYWSWLSLISIFVSLIPAFQAVVFGVQVLGISVNMVVRAMRLNMTIEADTMKVHQEITRLKAWLLSLVVVLLVHVSLLSYALAKLYGAVYYCPNYLWNASPPFCVDLNVLTTRVNCTLT